MALRGGDERRLTSSAAFKTGAKGSHVLVSSLRPGRAFANG